jgi:hypothetical protein
MFRLDDISLLTELGAGLSPAGYKYVAPHGAKTLTVSYVELTFIDIGI